MFLDEADARLVVEAGISPPVSPGGGEEEEEEETVRDHIVVEGDNPLEGEEAGATSAGLRVKSPNDINQQTTKKRFIESSSLCDTSKLNLISFDPSIVQLHISGSPERKLRRRGDSEETSTAHIIQKMQREMTEKFLQYQRESEVRFLAWEQERWRLEQSLTERWRNERRAHEKEMFGMFCGLLTDCTAALLERERTKHN